MVRASLLFRGVAVVLLGVSAASGQTPLSTTDFSDEFFPPAQPEIFWQPSFGQLFPSADDFASPIVPVRWRFEDELAPTFDLSADDDPPALESFTAFDASPPKDSKDAKGSKKAKDSSRLKPTPSSSAADCPEASTESPQSSPFPCEDGCSFAGDESFPFAAAEEFPCDATMLPFACSPHKCRKCRRRHRRCGGGCDLDWSCGVQECSGFCESPSRCGRLFHRKHRFRKHSCAWSDCGSMDGMMDCGCSGFYCSPCPSSCHRHRFLRRHRCHEDYGGYPECGFGDFGSCMGGSCYQAGCGHHRRGLFHRCRARHCAPMPCSYPCSGFDMQPCMGMDMDMGMNMGMGMDEGFCPSCSMP